LFNLQPVKAQLIPYCEKGKWGFANTSGKILIPCIYDTVELFSDDKLAKVKLKGKYGYINEATEIIIPIEYDDCARSLEIVREKYTIGLEFNPKFHLEEGIFDFRKVRNSYILNKNKKNGVATLNNDSLTLALRLQ
jgi:hypothetical protein